MNETLRMCWYHGHVHGQGLEVVLSTTHFAADSLPFPSSSCPKTLPIKQAQALGVEVGGTILIEIPELKTTETTKTKQKGKFI